MPVILNSVSVQPEPSPSTARPFDSSSSVAMLRAVTAGCRNRLQRTSCPMRMRFVAVATTAACTMRVVGGEPLLLPLRPLEDQVVGEVDGAESERLRRLRDVPSLDQVGAVDL